MNSTSIICLSIALFAAQLALCQEVAIHVQSAEDATPIANAIISSTTSNKLIRTDSVGVAHIFAANFSVSYIVSAPGYCIDSVSIPAKSFRKTTAILVHLRPLVYDFSEIMVEGFRPDLLSSTYGVSRITADELMYHINPGGEIDVFEGLKTLPGVTAVSDFSSAIRVRGVGFQYNQVLLDGIELFHPYHMAGFMGTVQSDFVQGLEFYRDAAPARYGGKLSSIAHIQTRAPKMDSFHATLSISVTNASLGMDIPVTEDWGIMVGARSMYLGPVVKEISDNAIQYNFHDLYVKNLVRLDTKNSLTLSGLYAYDDALIDSDVYFKNYHFEGSWRTTMGSVRWNYSVNEDESIEVVAGISDFYLLEEPEIQFDEYIEFSLGTRDFTLSGTYNRRMDNHDLLASCSVQRLTTWYGDYISTPKMFSPAAVDGNIADATLFQVALDDTWRFASKWVVSGGVRVEYFSNVNFIEPQPRFSFTFEPINSLSLHAGFSRMVQFTHMFPQSGLPIPNERRIFSNAYYPPEVLNGLSFGGSWFLGQKHLNILEVDVYYRNIENIYGIVDYPERYKIAIGKGSGSAYGLESSFEGNYDDITYRLVYALGWSDRTLDGYNDGAMFPAKDDIRHDLLVQVRWKISPDFEAGATWRLNSGSRMTIPVGTYYSTNRSLGYPIFTSRNAQRLPSYHRLDLFARYFFTISNAKASTYLNLYNAYNYENAYYYYYYDNSLTSSFPYVFTNTEVLPIVPSMGFSIEI